MAARPIGCELQRLSAHDADVLHRQSGHSSGPARRAVRLFALHSTRERTVRIGGEAELPAPPQLPRGWQGSGGTSQSLERQVLFLAASGSESHASLCAACNSGRFRPMRLPFWQLRCLRLGWRPARQAGRAKTRCRTPLYSTTPSVTPHRANEQAALSCRDQPMAPAPLSHGRRWLGATYAVASSTPSTRSKFCYTAARHHRDLDGTSQCVAVVVLLQDWSQHRPLVRLVGRGRCVQSLKASACPSCNSNKEDNEQ